MSLSVFRATVYDRVHTCVKQKDRNLSDLVWTVPGVAQAKGAGRSSTGEASAGLRGAPVNMMEKVLMPMVVA